MRSLEIDGFVALATISLIFSRCLAPTVHVKAWLQVKNIIYFRIICFEIYEFYLQLPYAAKQGISEIAAIKQGMEIKSVEFVKNGAEIYRKQ